jgi:DNA polymerase-3 subunit beta
MDHLAEQGVQALTHPEQGVSIDFIVDRDRLQAVMSLMSGITERAQTFPILQNVLITIRENGIEITASDSEIEIVAFTEVRSSHLPEGFQFTCKCRTLLDICNNLPAKSEIRCQLKNAERMIVSSGRSSFNLGTLPAAEYPDFERVSPDTANKIRINSKDLKRMIHKTRSAIAQQDVRYYLNGLLLEFGDETLTVVSTDGHRLSMDKALTKTAVEGLSARVILPRKAVEKLYHLLDDSDENIIILLGDNQIELKTPQCDFTSKFIDGQFPDYPRVIPAGGSKVMIADVQMLKDAFLRASILANEKYRGVKVYLNDNQLLISANNPEQEEAKDELLINYNDEPYEASFNVEYLIDVLKVLETDSVEMHFGNSNASVLIQEDPVSTCKFVIMPLRI